ncbi:MAG: M20/M25/M40 family metallo-hydrolase, partial [Longimicrobiales bacterium]|nr:M20/M25/M40 family metallo-hydrolase [Longimicrobiales bacterium]
MPTTDADSRPGVLDRPDVERSRELIDEWDERTLELQVELTEIPAPPFGEEVRAARVADHFRDFGLKDVRIDEVGNVVAELPAGPDSLSEEGDSPPVIVVSAHLDTIFSEGTDVRVRREGDRLCGPGISDDGRGLAVLLTLGRLFVTLDLPLGKNLRFVATVGEEGAGNLRGVRHL